MFREFETVVPRKKRDDLRYRWKLSNLLMFLADTETSTSDGAARKGVEGEYSRSKLCRYWLVTCFSSYIQI